MTRIKPLVFACLGAVAVLMAVIIYNVNSVAIELADVDAVTGVIMCEINEGISIGIAVADNQSDIDTLLALLSGAKKASLTWYGASNDAPAQANYLMMEISAGHERKIVYLYASGNNGYVYEPYVGIYKLERAKQEEIYQLYTSLAIAVEDGAGSVVTDGSGGIAVGRIKIVSGAEEYTPLKNWIYSLENGLFADGVRKYPKDVTDELISIPIGDDFQIIIEGKTTEAYTLYDDEFGEIYFGRSTYKAPSEQGEYILCIEASWGNEKQYVGYQYFFKLRK